MKATLNQDFKIIQDESGGSKQQQRVLEEELAKEETVNEIRAGQQFVSDALINDDLSSSAIIDVDNSDDDTALVRVVSAIESGSDQDIQNALEGALTDVSSTIARDKTKTKKQLEKLDEIVSVLEATSRFDKINPELGTQLTGQRQQTSQNISALESTRLVGKDGVLQSIQNEVRSQIQGDLREVFNKTAAVRSQIQAQISIEVNPVTVATLRQALSEVTRQAHAIRDVAIQQNGQNAGQQIESLASLRQSFVASEQALRSLPVSVEARQALTQTLDSRLDAVKNVQSQQAGLQALSRISEISKTPASLKTSELATQGLSKEVQVNPEIKNPEQLRPVQAIKPEIKAPNNLDQIKRDNVVQIAGKESPVKPVEKAIEPKDNVVKFPVQERQALKPTPKEPTAISKPTIKTERAPLGKVDKVANTGHPPGCGCPACAGVNKTESRDAKMTPATKVVPVERSRAPMGKADKVANTGHPPGCGCPACAGVAGVENARPSMQASNAGRDRQRAPAPTTTPNSAETQEPLQQAAAGQSK